MKFLLVLTVFCTASVASQTQLGSVDSHRDILGTWVIQPTKSDDCKNDVFALKINETETYLYSTCDLPHKAPGCPVFTLQAVPEKCITLLSGNKNAKETQVVMKDGHRYTFVRTATDFAGSETVEKCIFEKLPIGKFCLVKRIL